MDNKTAFNAAVCLIGTLILLILTAIHFAVYYAFSFLKSYCSSDGLVYGFYTGFFLASNVQAFLLFLYTAEHVGC